MSFWCNSPYMLLFLLGTSFLFGTQKLAWYLNYFFKEVYFIVAAAVVVLSVCFRNSI